MRTSSLLALPSSDLQHTIGHIDCPACDADAIALSRTTELKLLKFKEAAAVCLQDELTTAIKPRTHKDHIDFTRRLSDFLGDIVLEKMHEGHILNYQKKRAHTAGAELINHEVSWLSHVLDRVGLWAALKNRVHRLMVTKSRRGRALEPEEQQRLILCAASDPRWTVAYLCSLMTVNVGTGAGEIRHIRLKDVDMRGRVVRIREGTKNDYRERNVPFTATIQWICEQLLKRYYKICERQGAAPHPEHFILPFLASAARRGSNRAPRGATGYDLTRPMSSWRSAWESLREKADLPTLRMYDLRHHVATEWMEDSAISEETVESLMGHVTRDMKKDYEHIRDKAKLEALLRHEVKPAPRIVETPGGLVELPVLPQPKPPASEKTCVTVTHVNHVGKNNSRKGLDIRSTS